MGDAILTEGLTKWFGAVHAVTDLDLRVRTGEIFGFLGPNGSGKSTTIKLLLDELRPTRGRATVLGLDSHVEVVEVHRRVGYLPGDLSLPPDMTAGGYLAFLQRLRGHRDPALSDELVERFGLDPTRRIRELSTGNRRKVGLVQALMSRPELVLLDEPTAGLDPLVQHDLHDLLRSLAHEGTTVLLSSHTLSEVERLADRVGIIRDGRLVTVDEVVQLKHRVSQRIDVEFLDLPDKEHLRRVEGVQDMQWSGRAVSATIVGPVDPFLRQLVRAGTVLTLRSPEADLEDVFLQHYRSEDGT